MHGLFEVNGVQNFQPVAVMQQHLSALGNDAALRVVPVKIENRRLNSDK